jgi:CubicO group peptidase (beta-lactamase class C family)
MHFSRRHVLGAGAALAALGAPAIAHADMRTTGGGRGHVQAMGALRRYVEQHRADWGLPGMSVCAVDRDGFVAIITAGFANLDSATPMRPDHVLQVGSISKVFAALTTHALVQEGKLATDARLRALMPDVPITGADDVRLQHLLNHTSGLPADPPLFPAGGLWTGFAPGSHWSYSNTGYMMVGRIAQQADGRLYRDAVTARVLQPLGMTHTFGAIRVDERGLQAQGYEPLTFDRAFFRPSPMAPAPWVDTDNAAGCIASTPADMALFLRFLMKLADGRGGPVLSDEMARRFMADPAEAPGWAEHAKYGNGLARVRVGERDYIHHTGGMVSFCSSMHIDAAAGVAAFASSNVSHLLHYRPRAVTLYACELLRAARENLPAPTPQPTRASVDQADLYAGSYVAASGERFDISVHGDQITMRCNGRDSDMQQVGGPIFACREPRFAATGLVFESDDNEKLARAWAGDVEFAKQPANGYKPAAPAELQALAGHYDSDDRWNGPINVVARSGGIWVDNTDPLVQLPDGSWRVSTDEWSPERVRFEGFVNGRPSRLLVSGAPFLRRFS